VTMPLKLPAPVLAWKASPPRMRQQAYWWLRRSRRRQRAGIQRQFDAAAPGNVDLTGNNSLWHRITSHPVVNPQSFGRGCLVVRRREFYRNNMNDALVVDRVFDLTGMENPYLKMWHYLDKMPTTRRVWMFRWMADNLGLGAAQYAGTTGWLETDINLPRIAAPRSCSVPF